MVFVAVLAVVLAVALPFLFGSDDKAGSPAAGSDPGVAHVHGLGVDPKDGTLYAATHHGVFRIPASGTATRIADRYQDTMGFTVVGPRHFLGSGHPDLREDKPSRLGLIESTDGGETWQSLSLEGRADFHVLAAAHGRVYGFDAASSQFMVSTDRRSWESRGLTPLVDFAVSPTEADTILATLQDGLARSTDGGRSFAIVTGTPPLVFLAWPAADLVYGVTVTGAVMASSDGGATWEQRGSLDGRPEALIADGSQIVHAATESGIYTSTDGGRTFRLRYRG
ncbi:F510_1955 family glycosylhydrolase [Kribbella caucasensis]|uniref:F510_1955 family glycosylhydrolase n=1 Tax=Kribbella caucasensis TaxID=2512215 RepID=UPI001415134A|nr:sialidase family protein [Kribbella sp. VKM Ac-2527]